MDNARESKKLRDQFIMASLKIALSKSRGRCGGLQMGRRMLMEGYTGTVHTI